MKRSTRLVALALAISFCATTPSFADVTANYEYAAADLVIARPLWLAATVVGTGLFIVSLPVAAMSKSVNKTGRTLVAKPAHATFTRPLGDFSFLD